MKVVCEKPEERNIQIMQGISFVGLGFGFFVFQVVFTSSSSQVFRCYLWLSIFQGSSSEA